MVIRCDTCDIPDGFIAVVNETAYGNWGWGQLDFAAAMADEEFCEAIDDANYRLRDVLRNILLHSALPLAERKTLMVHAVDQYKAYMIGILDSLPRQVLVAVVRSAKPQLENEMNQSNGSGAPTPTAPANPEDAKPVTRADIKAILAELLPDAIKTATATRSEPVAEPAPAAPAVAATPEVTTITRADLTAAMAEAVKPVVERMEKLEGITVVRSANSDNQQQQVQVSGALAAGTEKDVFRGAPAFSGLRIPRPASK